MQQTQANRDWTANSRSTYATLGASNHTDKEREVRDFYCTPFVATMKLLEQEQFSKDVWECACVDKETEILTPQGWIPINRYNGQKIMVCENKANIPSHFDSPLAFIESTSSKMYKYHNDFLNMRLSEGHRVLYYNNHSVLKTRNIEDIVLRHEQSKYGFKAAIPTGFLFSGNLKLDEWHLRLAVACQADGYCEYPNTNRFRVSVKKSRKIQRMVYLLDKCDIPYRRNNRKDNEDYEVFTFRSKYGCKIFPVEWYNLCEDNKKQIIDEVFNWDGTITKGKIGADGKAYYTTVKSNADFIQFCIASLGMSSNISVYKKENCLDCYRVSLVKRNKTWIFTKNGKHSFQISSTGIEPCYCFKTATGYFLCRREGRIFVTGNCGAGHISTVLKEYGYEVRSSDIEDRVGNEVLDFLSCKEPWNGSIVTNPPFKYAQEFVEKALELLPNRGKCAFLLRLQFLEGIKRRKLFDENPPKTVYVFSKRIQCCINGEFEKYKGVGSAIPFAWFVWAKGYKGDTVVKWI